MSTDMHCPSSEQVAELLVGHRIVSAEEGDFPPAEFSGSAWGGGASGKLVLDDGTVIYVRPNIGGCSCGAGDYSLARIAAVDNIITSARVAQEETGDGEWAYRIFVVADAVEVNVMSVEGDDGNGYYGTGYELFVVEAVSR